MIYEPCKAWYVKWRFVMRKFTAVYIAVVAVVYTIVNLQAALMQNWMPAYLHLWPYLLFCTYVLASAVLAFGGFLLNLYPRVMGFQVFEPIVWVIKALARKLGRPIRPHRDDEEHEQNSMLGLLLSAPVIGVVFFIVLMAVLPTLVLWEENVFREGIHSLWDAIWRSLAFGLAHMLVGVPLAAALAIACVGVVLAAAYAIGGIPLSFAVHFHYDVAIFGVIAIGVCGKFARKLWNMRHH